MEQILGKLTGATRRRAVAEGHQSLVFDLPLSDGERAAAKVIDASLVDGVAFDETGPIDAELMGETKGHSRSHRSRTP